MNIGSAARKSGLPAKTIRYYEEVGLIAPGRAANGYRDYSSDDVHRLGFLRRSRAIGFSVEECRQLLSLYGDRRRESSEVRQIAAAKLAEIDARLVELRGLRDTLHHLVMNCHGDARPDCPIIDNLAGAPELPAGQRGGPARA